MGFLPKDDADHLQLKSIAYREVDENGQKGIILLSYPLPEARFDAGKADILVLLPSGYPDVCPDMFYLFPWVRLVPVNCYPRKADYPFQFAGQTWQRWSRHNPEWRSGVDGIWTMLKRIDNALLEAAA